MALLTYAYFLRDPKAAYGSLLEEEVVRNSGWRWKKGRMLCMALHG